MPRTLKLSRMEIIGFKSFYGRTRFEFPDGITAVVGPNGCGKSNIGDAISWVLGEQRVSLLRSDRMEDMIFNGSDSRRPLGMAEVSLHFTNLAALAGAGGNGHGGNGHHPAAAGPPGAPAQEAGQEAIEVAVPIPSIGEAVPSPAGPHDGAAAPADSGDPAAGEDGGEVVLLEIPDEMTVTRRLYRSGESEYSLNGRRCRLRDIQDLLARTDVGSRLYSTIEQGKIDQILVAKPKERRAMFEEAAGILGYKGKRRQAEQKLEAAQANLLRIGDIVAEVEKQIGTLKRQAAKARRYRGLLEELRVGRRAILHRRLLRLDADRRATGEALDVLREQDAAAAAHLAREEANVETLRLKRDESEEAARRRQEAIFALDRDIDRLQERVRVCREQRAEIEARREAIAREIDMLGERGGDQERRREDLVRERAEASGGIASAQAACAVTQAAQDAVAGRITQEEGALEGLRAAQLAEIERHAALSRQLATVTEQARALEATVQKIDRDAAELSAQALLMEERLAGLERGAEESAGSAARAAGDRDAVALEVADLQRRLSEAERAAEELKGRSAAQAERLVALREMERQHAGFADGVRAILDAGSGCAAIGVVGERLTVSRGFEQAVEAVLAGLLDAVVVPELADAARGIAHLRGTGRGRVSFVGRTPDDGAIGAAPPADLAALPGVIGLLADRVGGERHGPIAAALRRTVVVATLDDAIVLHARHPEWIYVTPEGDVVHPGGLLTGGDGRVLQHGILARRAEMEEVGRQAAEAVALRDAALAALPDLQGALAAARERLRIAEGLALESDRDRFARDLALQNARAERARIERSLPALSSESARLVRARAAGEEEARRLASEASVAERERGRLEDAIRSASAILQESRRELEAARQAAGDAKAALAAGTQRLGTLEREIEAVEAATAAIAGTAARRRVEGDECAARLEALRLQEGGDAAQLEAGLAARAGEAERDEAAHAGLAYDRSVLHAREQAIKEARAAHEERRAGIQEKDLAWARLEAELDHVGRTCRDDLAVSLEELRAAEAPDESRPLEECAAEVESLKAQVEAIGPVNLMAIEQCAELEERGSFLGAQKKDLEDAIEALRDAIRRINRQSRERFVEAFQAIQGHFEESFRTLFNGGRAELRLQEGEDDVLEAGIEIVAQPPGKRLQKIALLSGGEKALTAVALLFALFRYRPSPFCVLDEVDAPLDEANVDRFTRLLRALREDTQFILITHNRKSMEAADLLYGVTMEEPGVSKVLPLRFE